MFRSLIIAAFMVVSMPAMAAEPCAYGPLPVINITASESEPRFAYNLTQAQLKNFKGNADVPLAAIYDLTVNAMSTGRMTVNHNIRFTSTTTADAHACVQVANINAHIHIDPVIYIAKELRSEACEYKEYLLHELKHVEEDRRLIEDYKAVILRNMAFAFPAVKDYAVGPLPPSLLKEAQESLSGNVTGALQATIDSMLRERSARQRTIDNTGEYLRLSRACL